MKGTVNQTCNLQLEMSLGERISLIHLLRYGRMEAAKAGQTNQVVVANELLEILGVHP